MQIQGKVLEVSEVMQVTETFRKRELIVEYIENNPSYPEYLKFEALQDKCDILDNIKAEDEVEVHFNLRGRPWTGKDGQKKYFNSLVIWKVNVLTGQENGEGTDSVPNYDGPDAPPPQDDDDLPF